jgi:LysR family glycine cleavage system transcriptional activator
MPRKLPPLNALRAFEAAARQGSFVAAAAELGVTPAAVSQQVKALEAGMGTALFRRLAHGLVLTETGARLLPALTEAFDRVAEATTGLSARAPSGIVTITMLPALAAGWLVPRLGRFRRAYPEIDIVLRTDRRLMDFGREDIDVAIRFGRGPFRGLSAYHLMDEEVTPVASPRLLHGRAPIRSLADLAGEVLLHDIDAHPTQWWMSWRAWFAAAGLPESLAARGLSFSDSSVLIAAAVAGQGVALGRLPMLEGHLVEGHLVPVLSEVKRAEWSYWLVAPASHFARAPVRAFRDWLLAENTAR